MKIASWNVNSIRARLPHVTAWVQSAAPDVVLIQEIKGAEFPSEVFRELGYESAFVGQKAYNGVATLSRTPMELVSMHLDNRFDDHARYIEVMIGGMRVVNVYMPNGNPVGSDKFLYKLQWMDRLMEHLPDWAKDSVPTIIGGDYNVIPEDIDCHKPSSWMRDALFQPEPRERYRAMLAMGYTDAFRSLHPGETGQFTFWDYFRQAFEHNRGIRIDHFLLSPAAAQRLQSCEIDKNPRTQPKPSDHTPIVLVLS
jgi:exodeoxyribonuclease-3